jgi:ankyrin repeat protein
MTPAEKFQDTAWNGRLHAVQTYIGKSTPPTTELNQALVKAAAAGHLPIVELLVHHGADVNAVEHMTPLVGAASNLEVEVVRWLLAHGADVNKPDECGQTALHAAINAEWNEFRTAEPERPHDELRETELTRLLIEHGADINAETKDGKTPLDTALNGYHPAAEKLLRSLGARTGKGEKPSVPL